MSGSLMSTQRISLRKRVAIVAASAVLVLGGGAAAFAYWTGTATTGESVDFTVASTAPTGDPLTPGGTSQSVAFTVTNTAATSQTLSSVVVTVANADGTAWVAVSGCSAADYTVAAPVIVYGPIAQGDDAAGTVAVSMVNSGTDQDACQNITVPLYFAAS
jgi:hypothetical protein